MGIHSLRDPRVEIFIGITAVAVASCVARPFALVPLLIWALGLGTLHALAMLTARRLDCSDEARFLAVLGGWAVGLAELPAGPPLWWGMGAFLCAISASLLANRRRAVQSEGRLAQEQAMRQEAEAAFLQAIEEIRRLRIDVKTGGDVHQQLSTALQETSGELQVLRSKADALSHTLQRVMPFEAESGLLNAAKFGAVLKREAARMQRQELPLTLVCLTLDHFAHYEHSHGRVLYEAVIRRVAEVLHKAGNRPGDVAGRFAEHKFALLFPEAEHHHGLQLAETVRARLYQLGVPNRDSPLGVITASLGTATILPSSDTTATTLRERAEAALYEANFQGGNRCVRFRTAQTINIEHWDIHNEGVLTLESLRHKLAILGYDGYPKRFKPGEAGRERRVALDSVEAVIEGTLQVMFEGEARTLHPGDCLYLPKGTVAREEVLGGDAVLCLHGTRT